MTNKLYILIFCLIGACVFAQEGQKEKLQRENTELKKQISTLNKELAQSQKESRLSVSNLKNLEKKIKLREDLYRNTQKEKRFIEDDIYLRQLEINKLNRELAKMRSDYAGVLVKAYKNKGVQNKITFILSSKNLGEAIRRVQYLKQYSDFQDQKAVEIGDKKKEVEKAIAQREKSKKEKETLLVNQERDLKTINSERDERTKLLEDFKKNEARLTVEIQRKQNQSKKLDNEIRRIIDEEIRVAKAKEEAERKAEEERKRLAKIAAEREKARIEAENKARAEALEKARLKAEAEARRATELAEKKAAEEKKRQDEAEKEAANQRALARKVEAERIRKEADEKAKEAEAKAAAAREAQASLAREEAAAKKAAEATAMKNFNVGTAVTSANFAENRGKMPFPVARGQVTHYFGRQPHPIFKGIEEENSGIRISVPAGTVAKAVFPGVVSQVLYDGANRTVVVRHGTNYFTVYSNLNSTNVSKNQKVETGTVIGTVGLDIDGTYTMEFQVWNGSSPVDPLGWVRR